VSVDVRVHVLGFVLHTVISVATTLGLLAITKNPPVVMIGAPTIATAITLTISNTIQTIGSWDAAVVLGAVLLWVIGLFVAIGIMLIGLVLKWRFVLGRKEADSERTTSAP